MAKEYKLVEIDLGSNRTGVMSLPTDITEYFNIPTSTTTATARTRTRKAHTRRIFTGLNDTTGKSVAVEASRWEDTPTAPKRGAGKSVIVPTEIKTADGRVRRVTMNFPSNAVIGAISKFLFTKCVAHKPTYFIIGNTRHLVANVAGDVNPGETPETPAAP